MGKIMNKFQFLSILLPISFNLFSMESGITDIPKEMGEPIKQQLIPGIVNDSAKEIIEQSLILNIQKTKQNKYLKALKNLNKKASDIKTKENKHAIIRILSKEQIY